MIGIVGVNQDGKDGIWVRFSDGTAAGYIIEELLELRPVRMAEPSPSTRGDQLREPITAD